MKIVMLPLLAVYYIFLGCFVTILFPFRLLTKKKSVEVAIPATVPLNEEELKNITLAEATANLVKTSTEATSGQSEAMKAEAEKAKKFLKEEEERQKIEAKEQQKGGKQDKIPMGEKINAMLEKAFSGFLQSHSQSKERKEAEAREKNIKKLDPNRPLLIIDYESEDVRKFDNKVIWEYEAKSPDGLYVKDYFAAFSKLEVHSYLTTEGYEVYSIRTDKMIQLLKKSRTVHGAKFKTRDLVFFVTQLSTYLKAGIPLADAMQILKRQFKRPQHQKLFGALIYDLTMGESFSVAMAKQDKAFPRILINMVRASEMTGELPEALDDMAIYFTEADRTRKQMVTALMYPTIVFVLAIVAITFIMIYIVPQFVTIYQDMDNAELPVITVMVMNLSDFLQRNLLWLITGIALIILIIRYLYKNVKLFRNFIQFVLMKLPIIGEVIIYNEVTMFTKTFASLLKHNVFITETMEILSKITNNEIWRSVIIDTVNNLGKGEKISLSFENHWAVPIPAYEMIVTGEKTGQLPEMMQKVSDYYQELHKNAVGRIKAFVEPILILFLTGAVGLIVLSIVIPMFGMYNNLS